MDIFKVAGAAVLTALLSLTLRQIRPELGMQTALAGGAVIMMLAAAELSGIARSIRGLSGSFGVGSDAIGAALKITGIAYITQISADICRDAGESALASKTEICGRILMVAAALPVLTDLLGTLSGLAEEYL